MKRMLLYLVRRAGDSPDPRFHGMSYSIRTASGPSGADSRLPIMASPQKARPGWRRKGLPSRCVDDPLRGIDNTSGWGPDLLFAGKGRRAREVAAALGLQCVDFRGCCQVRRNETKLKG